MTHVTWKWISVISVLIGLLWACSGNGSSDPTPGTGTTPNDQAGSDRKVMLTNIADNIIVPSYATFKTKFDAMLTKSDAFAARPDKTTLTEFRQAWVDAYTEWQKVELFDVGPAEQNTLRFFMNIYPTDVAGVETYVAAGTGTFDTPVSYSRQGFPAIDYMINGLGTTDDAIVARYTTAADATKRIAYLKRLTSQMNTTFTTVNTAWTTGGYRDTFVNCTGLDAGCSTSKLINGYVLNYERYIRSGKIGFPAGATANTLGVVSPERVEAYYKKDLSLTLARTAQQATVDFFNGKNVKTGAEGPGLKSYLNSIGAKDAQTGKTLVDVINAQFDVINQKLTVLKGNLSDEVRTNDAAVIAVYTEMQRAVRMLKVDMTSAMSITITYTDNDGD